MFKKLLGTKKQDAKAYSKNTPSLFDEIATRSTAGNLSGFLDILPNPDYVLRKKGLQIQEYRKLLSDPHVGACVESRKAGVTSLLWQIDCDDKNSQIYQVVSELFNNIDIYSFMEDVLNAPLYGYQPIEIIWEKVGSWVLPKELIAKPQEWFCFDSDNVFKLKGKSKTIEIPQFKMLLPRNRKSYTNPYGEAILSRVFWDVIFKRNGYKFWVTFVEKYGMPHIWGWHQRNADDEEIKRILKVMDSMVQDAVAAFPEGTKVEMKESSSKDASSNVYDTLTNRCDQNISKGILGQTLTTEIGSSGSYAASNTHNEVRKDIIGSDKRLFENCANHLIRMINDLNFNSSDVPKLSLYKEEDIDKLLAERDEILRRTGVIFAKKYFVSNYGLNDDEFEVEALDPVNNFAKQKGKVLIQDASESENIDSYASVSDEDLENCIKGSLKPVLSLIKETNDPQAALEKLADIYPEMNTKQLEETLTRIFFVSDIIGRLEAQDETEN